MCKHVCYYTSLIQFFKWRMRHSSLCLYGKVKHEVGMTQLFQTSGNNWVAVIQLGKTAINPLRMFGLCCANTCCTEDGLGLTGTCCAVAASPTFCIHHLVLSLVSIYPFYYIKINTTGIQINKCQADLPAPHPLHHKQTPFEVKVKVFCDISNVGYQ